MSQVQITRSSVAGEVPATLLIGAMWYNSADNKLFIGEPGNVPALISDDPAVIQATLNSQETRIAALEAGGGGGTASTTVASTAPASASTGDMWFDTSLATPQLKIYANSAWANATGLSTDFAASGYYPVTAAEFFTHIVLTPTAADTTQSTVFIAAATMFAEQYTRRLFVQRDVTYTFDGFPSSNYKKQPFNLYGGAVSVITDMSYYNTSNVSTAISPSSLRIVQRNGNSFLYPVIGAEWPTDCTSDDCDVISVTYTVGESPSLCPAPVKAAILMLAASMWENRENEVFEQSLTSLKPAIAAKDLLHPFKLR